MAKKRARITRGRLTAFDQLPDEAAGIVAEAAAALRERDRTQQDIYEEFFAALQSLQAESHGELEFAIPSRSSFNRYSIRLATLSHRLDETRRIAEAISEKFDAQASDDLTLIAAEAIKTLVFEILTAAGEAGVDPKGAKALADALRSATQAQTVSTARRQKVEAEFAANVDKAVDQAVKVKGLTADLAEQIKKQILGVG